MGHFSENRNYTFVMKRKSASEVGEIDTGIRLQNWEKVKKLNEGHSIQL